jgi:hypothetical protein
MAEQEELRCRQLLLDGTASALEEAVDAAHTCVGLDEKQVRGYLLLTEALTRLDRHEDAVAWFKKGVHLVPRIIAIADHIDGWASS